MDQLIADAAEIDNVKMNDEVLLFGNGKNGHIPTADDIAKWTDTINYEVVCLVSKRVARVYLQSGKEVGTVDHLLK